jgi:hypothetical protein
MIKPEQSQQEPRKNTQVAFNLPPDLYSNFLEIVLQKQLLPRDVFQHLIKDYVNNNGYRKKIPAEAKQKGFII